MIEILITIGLILGFLASYALTGVAFARRYAVAIYREKLDENRKNYPSTPEEMFTGWAASSARQELVDLALFWPFHVVKVLVEKLLGGGGDLLMGPVNKQRARAEKLAADAKYWADVAAEEISPEKKSMAEELARVLREQAKEAEL